MVRQWFLAGDRERAIEIARRWGAFADAVLRLERSGKSADAVALRLLWADRLASAGDYAAAVDAVWPVVEARDRARVWMERAIEQGGPTAARMLVRQLVLGEAFAEVRRRAVPLLEADDREGSASRQALDVALLPNGQIVVAAGEAGVRLLSRGGGVAAHFDVPAHRLVVSDHGDRLSVRVGGERDLPGEPVLTKGWIATWLADPEGSRVLVVDTKSGRIRAEIRLARAKEVALRLGSEFLTIGDDTGRILVLDLEEGRLLRNLRT